MANKDVIYIRHPRAELQAFRSPTGMVGRWTGKKAHEVQAHAIVFAPKPGQGRGYSTGETAANIRVKGPTVGRSGPEATIVSDTNHAVFVHEGTHPHVIKARPSGKMVFFWRKVGRVVFRDKVFHPGARANPFLVKALRSVFGGPGR